VTEDHFQLNRDMWDERAPAHAASPDYQVQRFVDDPQHLSDVVRFDQPRLGDIAGLRAVHLQCHIGTDTLSLARLGATMSGLDFSGASLEQARALATRCAIDIDFCEADVYAAVEVFGPESFDLVYTGVGALCWLPDLNGWARVIAELLRPGGRMFIRDSHPMLYSMDDSRDDGLLVTSYPYFQAPEPLIWDEEESYVQTDVVFRHTRAAEWTHGLGEIVTALLGAGLVLTGLSEHDSVPWRALPQMVSEGGGEWQLPDHRERLPLTFTAQARKPGPVQP
jgi:SAM-dependent methyltransferase